MFSLSDKDWTRQGVDDEGWARSFKSVYTNMLMPRLVSELALEQGSESNNGMPKGGTAREKSAPQVVGDAATGICEGHALIPLTVHHIWLGSELPERFKTLRYEWMRMHPPAQGWSFVLWDDTKVEQELTERPLHNAELYAAAQNWGEKSDILRLEILQRYGGVYVDVDFAPVQSLRPLLRTGAGMLCGLSNVGFVEVNNGLIAARPHHPAVLACVRALSSAPGAAARTASVGSAAEACEKVPSGPSEMLLEALGLDQAAASGDSFNTISRTGPGFFTRCVATYVREWVSRRDALTATTEDNGLGDVGLESACVVLPTRFFYPLANTQRIDVSDGCAGEGVCGCRCYRV